MDPIEFLEQLRFYTGCDTVSISVGDVDLVVFMMSWTKEDWHCTVVIGKEKYESLKENILDELIKAINDEKGKNNFPKPKMVDD